MVRLIFFSIPILMTQVSLLVMMHQLIPYQSDSFNDTWFLVFSARKMLCARKKLFLQFCIFPLADGCIFEFNQEMIL